MNRRAVAQFDLFMGAATPSAATLPDVEIGQELDLVAEALRQEAARLERNAVLRTIQLRLMKQGLWGFPNLIRNPDGPWRECRDLLLDWPTTISCWPASYVVRAAGDTGFAITLRIRPGASANPAVPRAVAVLADLGPVSLVPSTLHIEAYEAF
jgi:hypothetical protein